ncbi:MAG: hypothetical protein K9K64_01255 [Desulfohalobiaceae bacterium]|nr:hypothetical protein [Desulfohalobiaceae bacterium]
MPKKIFGCLLLGLLLAACNPLETTKKIYRGRAFPAKVDFEQGTGLKEKEQKLAQALSGTDEKIERLRLALERQGSPPSLQWMQGTVRSMPWLNGLRVLDSQGREMRRYPETQVKQLDLQDIHEEISNSDSRQMRLLSLETPFGREVCLVKPFFYQESHQGLLLAHFDFRTLLPAGPQSNEVMVFFPGKPLWSGNYGRIARELSLQDWNSLLAKNIHGQITIEKKTFYWLVRYVGIDPLVYAVAIE